MIRSIPEICVGTDADKKAPLDLFERGAGGLRVLSREPVAGFDQEHVARPAENRRRLATRSEIALERQVIAAFLLPDEVKRRAGTVLPAYHRIPAQRVGAEIRIADAE